MSNPFRRQTEHDVAKRDAKIVELRKLGLLNHEIGQRFGISPNQVGVIYRKMVGPHGV